MNYCRTIVSGFHLSFVSGVSAIGVENLALLWSHLVHGCLSFAL